MRNLLYALQFLTIIPVEGVDFSNQKNTAAIVGCFPLIGILLGLILSGLNMAFSYFGVSPAVTAAILTIMLIILTGGLHLDGLADTSDAFLSGKNDKDALLAILHDPHIGTMGAISIAGIILLKFSLIYSFAAGARSTALTLACFLSRSAMILPLSLFKYARNDGKAKIFFGGLSFRQCVMLNIAVLLAAVLISGLRGLMIFSAVSLFTFLFTKHIDKKLSGLTGDILGASAELNEVLILFLCLITAGI